MLSDQGDLNLEHRFPLTIATPTVSAKGGTEATSESTNLVIRMTCEPETDFICKKNATVYICVLRLTDKVIMKQVTLASQWRSQVFQKFLTVFQTQIKALASYFHPFIEKLVPFQSDKKRKRQKDTKPFQEILNNGMVFPVGKSIGQLASRISSLSYKSPHTDAKSFA